MDKEYKVLKKFGELKKGDIFAPTADTYEGTESTIAEAIAGKFIKEIAEESNATAVTVSFQGGTREFSEEIHGEDFMDVAKEFCATHNGTIL